MRIAFNPVWPILTAVLIIVFAVVFAFRYVQYLKEKKGDHLIVAAVAFSLMVVAVGFQVLFVACYPSPIEYYAFEYSLVLESASDEFEEVYVPIGENATLQNALRIDSGSGSISIIDTQYGRALKVNFTGRIDISGKIETYRAIGETDLTMVNRMDVRDRVEYWMYYKPYNSSDYNCSFRFSLQYEAEAECLWMTYESEGFLEEGWNTYWASSEKMVC